MLNWLIKFLGGFTQQEFNLRTVVLDSWRTRAIAAETTSDLYKDILTKEKEEIQRIRDLMREYKQPVESAERMSQPPNMKPITNNTMSSWPRIKRELERRDRVSNAAPTKEEVHARISQEETAS